MQKYRSTFVSSAVAVASVLLAIVLRLALNPVLGTSVPYVTFYAAVAVSAWFGGFGPGLLAIVLSSLGALVAVILPGGVFWPATVADSVGLGLFWAIGLILSTLSEWVLQNASQVRLERERFFTTLSSIGDAVVVTDTSARVEYLNSMAETFTGWTTGESIGKPLSEIFSISHAATGEEIENSVRLALDQRRAVGIRNHAVLTSRDGQKRTIEDSAAPLHDEKQRVIGVVLVFRDVTSRQRSQQALRESEARFRTLADSAPVLIWMADPGGTTSFFNKPWLEFTGHTVEAELGGGWKSGIHPDDIAEYDKFRRDAFSKESGYQMEFRLRRADGEYRWILDHGVPMFSGDDLTGFIGSCIDITERKAAEEALRESEERFRTITTNAPAAIFIKDLQGRYLLANTMAREVLKWPDYLEAPTDFDLLPEEQAAQIHEIDSKIIADREMYKGEVRVGREDRIFLVVKFPWSDGAGRLIGVCGVGVDITERKRAEAAQQESDRQFQLLADSIPQLVWMARPDGYIFWFNQRCFEYTGASPGELNGWNWEAMTDPADRSRVIESWRAALSAGTPWEESFTLRRHDGQMRWHLARAFPLKDAQGKVVRWFGTNTDISERRRTESTLRFQADVSEALSSLIDDQSTLQKLATLAVPHLADWCVAHLISSDGSLSEVALVHESDERRRRLQDYNQQRPPGWEDLLGIGEVLRTGQPELQTEITAQARRQTLPMDHERLALIDELHLVSSICVPLRIHGHMYGVLTVITAESGRIYDESDLQTVEDLAHRASISLENARLYDEVREAAHRKDEFLAMLSHELRNPLGPIRSGLEMLSMEQSNHPEMIGFMQQQVEHLVRLVDDLLDVSRIIRGRIDLRREAVEFRSIILRAVNVMKPQLHSQQQTISVHLDPQPLWMHADPVRLLQVVENLITNASKYSEAGTKIFITLSRHGDLARLSVRDQGIGMAPELLPRVFDLFAQATRSLDRSQGGLGIGLTLVKQMIEMHGGSVSAHSEGEGTGSEFIIQLPLAPEKPQLPERPPAAVHVRECRVLVVDDNRGNTRIISALLKKLGDYEIELAHDGHEAMRKVAEFQPHLLLLDIGLPGMDGYDVGRLIREQSQYDDLLLVALTGYGQAEDRRRSHEIGFDEHLVKPVSLVQLQQVLCHPKLSRALQPE